MPLDVDAFHVLIGLADDFYGFANEATIHGETVPAELQTASEEEIVTAGGRVDRGFAKVKVAVPDFTSPPRQGDRAKTRDIGQDDKAEVLKIDQKIGNLWTLIIGYQSAMDTRSRNLQ